MNRKKLHALYGLKWNPFTPDVPTEGLFVTPRIDSFCARIEGMVDEGGFALVTGEAGHGKSIALRILAERLDNLPEITVGVLTRPQSGLTDFYRELGELFAVDLKPHNRWCGFKALRERWKAHAEASLLRPVLLIDEGQEMNPLVLSELRILTAGQLDTVMYLTVVLAGDGRLVDRFRHPDLVPLGSRIRTRLLLEYAGRDELQSTLEHVLKRAGNANLLAPALKETLLEHAAGNYRVLMTLAGELLMVACERELPQIDEKLFFELYDTRAPKRPSRKVR
jgi:type II secretory pathway predicted ATPase ExeA